MFEWKPITPRVAEIREKYRTTKPKVDISRYRIVTEYYRNHPETTGILKRAKTMRLLFENMPTPVFEGEVIVGFQGATYRCCALYPETSFEWFMEELRGGDIPNREADPYDIDPEDEKYLLETGDYWKNQSLSAIFDEYMPIDYVENRCGNGVVSFRAKGNAESPVGHFCANFWKATQKGFGAIQKEAEEKIKKLEEDGIFGGSIYQYNFYRAVAMVSEGIIIWSKRYGAECERQAALEQNSERKKELLEMADTLNWIMEHPCRNFHDAVQCVYLYQLALCLDGQQHGTSFGRVDQYLGAYYEKDIAEGNITPEYAQELMDLFYLKVAECNKIGSLMTAKNIPGYTSGQLMTLGGVDKEGKDATNAVTYMMLQASGRLVLHDPPQALRIHKNTPDELWEAAIATNMKAGGVPTYEYDEVIIPSLMKRGIPLEDARNYCLIGCVEPEVCGSEWAQPGGDGKESYINIANVLLQAINNGTNPRRMPGAPEPKQTGLPTGYLYEMKSMEEVLSAVKAQMEFFCKWHCSNTNAWESIASYHAQLPLLSATMDGCMESGKDVMNGGAKYNSTGNSCIGLGNLADSLNVIDQVCFREKIATTRELYDALMNNWDGYEELRQLIVGKLPHYGNAEPECDKYLTFAATTYADAINSCSGPRGNHYQAGCYPVTLNVLFGMLTAATPDGRKAGEPLSDGISPVQGTDKRGPLATINSLLNFDQTEYGNGTLCNMKFHPTSLQGEEGWKKLQSVMQSYFEGGGMELQLNIVSGEMLREAQTHPENYKDLVVRIAGFSAYFVEVYKEAQDDLIRRTELSA